MNETNDNPTTTTATNKPNRDVFVVCETFFLGSHAFDRIFLSVVIAIVVDVDVGVGVDVDVDLGITYVAATLLFVCER